jgi:2-succinyl-5-enolpyruvyl-6-hydroxy-3-cyclohexene-1-carboxylate synthase
VHFLPTYNISKIVSEKGIKHAVICPGSRNAPITISFARNTDIKCYSITDERSAGFIALGMAQYLQKPVALICTSGTAALNFAPAIAEAYYQQIPLLVLTADRPPELIHQRDGQAINQTEVFRNYIKKSYQLLSENSLEAENYLSRITNEAIEICNSAPKGPVHINVPIREPFYPKKKEGITFSENFRIISKFETQKTLSKAAWSELASLINQFDKKLIVAGLNNPDLGNNLSTILNQLNIPVLADITSNINCKNNITNVDVFLKESNTDKTKNLKPELLITFGREVLSKNIKNFIRKNKPQIHIHIEESESIADTYNSITHLIPLKPALFFAELINKTRILSSSEYLKLWQNNAIKADKLVDNFIKTAPYGEFKAISSILENIEEDAILHFANSMPVRYASLCNKKPYFIYSNRGTSGIDGSNSTAFGSALISEKPTYLFTGDVSFLYDRNAFWNNYLPKNLKIIISNNHGGGIFRIIDGPSVQPELDEFFETKQLFNAQYIAKEFGFEYYECKNEVEFNNELNSFLKPSEKPKIFEIFSDSKSNAAIFESFRNLPIA